VAFGRCFERQSTVSEENRPKKEHFLQNPTNICGNEQFRVDNALQKVEGEHRRGSPHPHEHWRLRCGMDRNERGMREIGFGLSSTVTPKNFYPLKE
jgi:hypothetical protein